MKFTLGEIKKGTHNQPFTFDEEVDVSELETMNNDIRELKTVRVKGMGVLQGDEIIFTMTISGEMILPCARTLVDVPYLFDFNADRKSTRLNSSHVAISYAVFCLKKKNK